LTGVSIVLKISLYRLVVGCTANWPSHWQKNLAQADHGTIDFMRVVDVDLDDELYEDQMAFLQEVVMTELGNIPG